MSGRNVVTFLSTVAARADVLDSLKVMSKEGVLAAAADFGLGFTEEEFDAVIWALELHLAAKRCEAFDLQFPLWSTMWGKYYFEYLVVDLLPSLGEADFSTVLAAKAL